MSWIELRGCLDTGTQSQTNEHTFSRLYYNVDTCMAACVLGVGCARFQKGKDTDPLPRASCCVWVLSEHGWSETSAMPFPGQRHTLHTQQRSRMPRVIMDALEDGNDHKQRGLDKCNSVKYEDKGEWREESHRRRREPTSDAKGANNQLGVLAVLFFGWACAPFLEWYRVCGREP